MQSLPDFRTEEELAAWVDANDTAEFLDDFEDTDEQFTVHLAKFVTRPLDIRLRADLYSAIEAAAECRGIPYQMLIQTWLTEKLRQEAPDLAIAP
jgi:predicted DNA binding CopG/RHH family protein